LVRRCGLVAQKSRTVSCTLMSLTSKSLTSTDREHHQGSP
jgi:hypothetical protein